MKRTDFDIALCDVNLREEYSFDFARACLEKGIHVIFISGYTANTFPEDLTHTTMHRKPVEMDRMIGEMNTVMRDANTR